MAYQKLVITTSMGKNCVAPLMQVLEDLRDELAAAPPTYLVDTGIPPLDSAQLTLALVAKFAFVDLPAKLSDLPPDEHKVDPDNPKIWYPDGKSILMRMTLDVPPAPAPANYDPAVSISFAPPQEGDA